MEPGLALFFAEPHPRVTLHPVPHMGPRREHYRSCADCKAVGGILSHHPPYNDDPAHELWPPKGVGQEGA